MMRSVNPWRTVHTVLQSVGSPVTTFAAEQIPSYAISKQSYPSMNGVVPRFRLAKPTDAAIWCALHVNRGPGQLLPNLPVHGTFLHGTMSITTIANILPESLWQEV
jgi:hypothetical protein